MHLQVKLVGKKRLVLDLSCRKKDDGKYYVVTDRWQKFSSLALRWAGGHVGASLHGGSSMCVIGAGCEGSDTM